MGFANFSPAHFPKKPSVCPGARRKSVTDMSAPNVSFEAFLKQNGVARLWRDRDQEIPNQELGSLPLETLLSLNGEAAPASSQKDLPEKFSRLAEQVQEGLLMVRRRLVAARSQGGQAPSLVEELRQGFEGAREQLDQLKVLARRMGPEQRRVVRHLEGAPDWRRIKHQLSKLAKAKGRGHLAA